MTTEKLESRISLDKMKNKQGQRICWMSRSCDGWKDHTRTGLMRILSRRESEEDTRTCLMRILGHSGEHTKKRRRSHTPTKGQNEKKSEHRDFCANRENDVFFQLFYLVLVTPPVWLLEKKVLVLPWVFESVYLYSVPDGFKKIFIGSYRRWRGS